MRGPLSIWVTLAHAGRIDWKDQGPSTTRVPLQPLPQRWVQLAAYWGWGDVVAVEAGGCRLALFPHFPSCAVHPPTPGQLCSKGN